MEDYRRMCLVAFLVVFMAASMQVIGVRSEPQVPCFFIFGDSLSDSGNNNNLLTMAKAKILPYGIDFPDGPTGRFTNGKTTVDLIGDHLGLEGYIPPFSSVQDKEISKGVNYASGSAGILPETGYQVGMRISMDQQLTNHKTIVSKLESSLGKNNSQSHLGKCLYSVYVGNNDWMINYFSGGMGLVRGTPQTYADSLITKLSDQLNTLHDLGARKVILFGIGPLGCLPTLNFAGMCSVYVNGVLEMYNNKLKSLTDEFNDKLKDSKFIMINTIEIVSPFNLAGLGLPVKSIPCCGAVNQVCLPFSVPCMARNTYVYWDNAHPTEAGNKVLAARAYNAQKDTDAYPIDIGKLALL